MNSVTVDPPLTCSGVALGFCEVTSWLDESETRSAAGGTVCKDTFSFFRTGGSLSCSFASEGLIGK